MPNRKKGHVRFFKIEKGYGFIRSEEGNDYYFHIFQVNESRLPIPGDLVTFQPAQGKDGRSKAVSVSFAKNFQPLPTKEIKKEKMPQKKQAYEKPYYGSPLYTMVKHSSNTISKTNGIQYGFFIAFVISFLFLDVDLSVDIVMGVIGAMAGLVVAVIRKDEKYIRMEITSTCLKCGGVGQVTARSDGFIGFQCQGCKSFWKKRDKDL